MLVRARNPLNIGAAARAMKNFGLRDLVLVAVHPPVWQEARSAVGARDVLAGARVVETVAEAVADRTLVVGTTAGVRHPHEREFLTPAELGAQLAKRGRNAGAAILFGSEKTGLTSEELSHCHDIMRIPTGSECPSMNLGQAVAVFCYELARPRSTGRRQRKKTHAVARAGSVEELLGELKELMRSSGFFPPAASRSKVAKLRRTLIGLGLSERQVEFFRGAVAHIQRVVDAGPRGVGHQARY